MNPEHNAEISPAATPGSNIRVWLIEDNDAYRRSLSRVIDLLDDCVCEYDFDSAESAIRRFKEGRQPDVVLLDIGLPGIDGITAIGQIREIYPDCKLVILTVFDDHDRIFGAVCAGADGYLLKTSSNEDIERAIRETLAGGASMTPQVARKVLTLMNHSRPTADDSGLSPREMEVLSRLVEGMTKEEIGVALGISRHTVDKHVRAIYQKLHVNTRAGATAAAIRRGLV
ncbi:MULTISPECIES: response regulator transcription factor [Crateriforma]|uniref:Transcriptional regulatory protein DegU n=1 Tax=Crateriforma conspicua TaxID=2527996 RepID=A0A5C6FMT8_9PLAN|nr:MULTISPECIES: response regulator transcription factor [Crateriforma]TWU61673.1 Transcriptional regulatory protein DegU [Crateriforma conspicua]